jgi:signal transduction histidine kinase
VKLLAKNTLYLILFSFLIFTAGGFIFYLNLRTQIYQEVDQSLTLEKDRIIQKLMVSDSVPEFYTNFENQIKVETKEKDQIPYVKISDTLIYDSIEKDYQPFRKLQALIFLYTKAYQIDVSKSLINKGELISDVFLLMLSLFIALLIIMLVVNFFISRNLLKPFYSTLGVLKNYRVTRSPRLSLPKTRTKEFTLLNEVLNIMSGKIHSDFLSLKEFTENTSHEMQTPLAIIRAKLELLIQDESLKSEQLKLIQSISDSASRLSKMSRALVLITRIENLQFRETSRVHMNKLLDDLLDNFSEMTSEKNIELTKEYRCELFVKMNPALAEILLTNLVSNAIKHNLPEGRINIRVSECELMISNTGHPLNSNPDDLFHRFSKDGSKPDSLGLGLAIVKKIADTNNIKVYYTCRNNIHTLRVLFDKRKGD